MGQNTRFTAETITQLGIAFPTQAEAAAFAALLEEELEVRVGHELGRRLTDDEMDEFNAISDMQHSADWLDLHCPDYRSVVYSVWQQMEDEVRRFRHLIAGTCSVPLLAEDGLPLDAPEEALFL